MQKRHQDSSLYLSEQIYTTEKYVIPFIEQNATIVPGTKVLEVGCGEGGDLKPFADRGCYCIGIDINEQKINKGRSYYKENQPSGGSIQLLVENIYDKNDLGDTFDIIFLRDVIEHIPGQEALLCHLRNFMNENTVLFFAFPPWQNPFGGHQQICRNKFLSHIPFLHLLPKWLYGRVLKSFRENPNCVNELLEIKDTSITIGQFHRYLSSAKLSVKRETFYFINPHYEIKFGLKPRKTWSLITKIPYLRNFVTTSLYCNVGLSDL
ncbi:class I SAM-dependent methyltransferase [Bacteroidales bacterium OttesenSCG-928-M11]|nr:class I SAM-dependent methyltransferase [Bacteroidales bacterium OttesenSCG-928-M11]